MVAIDPPKVIEGLKDVGQLAREGEISIRTIGSEWHIGAGCYMKGIYRYILFLIKTIGLHTSWSNSILLSPGPTVKAQGLEDGQSVLLWKELSKPQTELVTSGM